MRNQPKRYTSRLLLFFLSLALVVTMAPMAVFAEEGGSAAEDETVIEEAAPAGEEATVIEESTPEADAPAEEPAEEPVVAAAEDPIDLSGATVSIPEKLYTGKARTPLPTVILDGEEIPKLADNGDANFTVSYSNNVNVGTASFTVKGVNAYTGSVTGTFTIKAKTVKDAKVTGIKAMTYTGKAIVQSPTVKVDLDGTTVTLKKGTDYTLTYKDNVNVGTATVTIKGKGNYQGSLNKTFTIKSRVNKSFSWSGVSVVFKTYVLRDEALGTDAKPTNLKLTGKSDGIKLTWTAPKGSVDGVIVLRKNSSGKYEEIAKVLAPATSFVDTQALSVSKGYSYRVVGYKASGHRIRISPATYWVKGVNNHYSKANGYTPNVDRTKAVMLTGETVQLEVTWPDNVYSTNIRWWSANKKVATVNKYGKITAKSCGFTQIHGRTASGRVITVKVKVLYRKYSAGSGFFNEGNYRYYASRKGPVICGKLFAVKGTRYYANANGVIKRSKFTYNGVTVNPDPTTGAISEADWKKIYQSEHKGKTYVLVDISDQKMYVYVDGWKEYTSDVVTGDGGTLTPTGTYYMNSYRQKDTYLTGPTWNDHVDYWMPFIDNMYGFHDASWRHGKFGGDIYLTDGSHGCVNLPDAAAAKLWKLAPPGTKVIIRK